jgi:hypothetical protein
MTNSIEYTAFFDHESYGPDEYFVMMVELPSPDLMNCLSHANYFWELLVETGKLPEDSYLYQVETEHDIVWSVDEQDA